MTNTLKKCLQFMRLRIWDLYQNKVQLEGQAERVEVGVGVGVGVGGQGQMSGEESDVR